MDTLPPTTAIGIIAGSGRLPELLAQMCRDQKRPYHVVGLQGYADPHWLAEHPHHVIRLGAIGQVLHTMRTHDIQHLILAGGVRRPSLSALRPDATAARWLARMGGSLLRGDNAVLSKLLALIEEEGFEILSADALLDTLKTPLGTLGTHLPSKQDNTDIHRGMRLAKPRGAPDLGQALVIKGTQTLAVEAAEGTAVMLARCAELFPASGGILLKACKPQQDQRVDLPSIGADTVAQAQTAGLVGIALEAQRSLLLDRTRIVDAADKAGLFVIGVQADAPS